MNFIKNCLVLIVCLYGTGCSNIPFTQKVSDADLEKTWVISDLIIDDAQFSGGDAMLAEALIKGMVEKGFMFNFFPDKKGTVIKGDEYNEFKWKFIDGSKSVVLFFKSKQDTFHILEYSSKKEREYLILEHPAFGKMEFLLAANMLKNYEKDPFYPSNNLWRIKPVAPESEVQILERLANHIKHTAYLLKASIEREARVTSFEQSMGIIRIYSGAVGIKDEDQIPESWINTFFNRAQAMKAYELYGEFLESSDYKGATSGSWLKDDYELLIHIYKEIQSVVAPLKALEKG